MISFQHQLPVKCVQKFYEIIKNPKFSNTKCPHSKIVILKIKNNQVNKVVLVERNQLKTEAIKSFLKIDWC